MGLHNQRLGRRGEALAARWYETNGYRILDRNWRCSVGEIDIVASGHGVVVFCEVKTRSSYRFGHPSEGVTSAKQHRIHRLGAAWLDAAGVKRPPRRRFDIAAVVAGQVSILKGAF
jgi:putative endonuclease